MAQAVREMRAVAEIRGPHSERHGEQWRNLEATEDRREADGRRNELGHG